ncbi:MAG: M48 family metalloprotease [Sphingorhabdus sp.]|uniref:M48 family metallopeptidase n=1 Tax=Sphingorhabdus sp. TaxID=1902408 RepID=UPI003CB99159
MKRLRHTLTVAALVVAAPIAAQPLELLPTSAGYQPKDAVEQGLWLEMDEAEQQMRASKFLIDDPELNAYVKGVLCRAVGTDKCGAARIYLMRTPQFNAAMAPNGMMLVWSGLLLRARNEAELAAVLGHEFVHFEQQHSLKSFRDIKAKSDAITWLGFVPGGMLAQIGLMGSVFRFNREMEKQADMAALDYLSASGYDPMAPSKIWEQLLGEMDVQAKANKSGAAAQEASDFFSSHPNTRDRMEYLRAAARTKAPSSDDGSERYRVAIARWWPRLIDDQVKLNDFAATEFLLDGLARGTWTADLLYARGELYRARGKGSDLAKAEGFYRQSLAKDPAIAESWRSLGMLLLRQGKSSEGRKMLRRYLDIAPAAGDRPMIEAMAREPQK